jgi:hypothetical protein
MHQAPEFAPGSGKGILGVGVDIVVVGIIISRIGWGAKAGGEW